MRLGQVAFLLRQLSSKTDLKTRRRSAQFRPAAALERLENRTLLTTAGLVEGTGGVIALEPLPLESEDLHGRSPFGGGHVSGAPGQIERRDTAGSTAALQPNIVVTQAFLQDGNGNTIANPVLGEMVRVRVQFTTFDLPADAAYEIHFAVDGVVLSSGVISFGADLAVGNWFWWHRGWYAEPGTHTVSVTVDVTNSVDEIDESDNTFSFSFTPQSATNLPQKFLWPLPGVPFQDNFLSNYVDLDPLSGIRDYHGGSVSYDGHDAIDTGAINFSEMDAGISVLAAAGGTVVEVANGGYDRNRGVLGNIVPGGPANYVIVDHGNGWRTYYWHLRRDSLHVKVGDVVQAGDVLGFQGSSGISTGPHLHFTVSHNNHAVETFLDPETYWLSPLPYIGEEVYLIDSGVSNYDFSGHLDEGPSEVGVFGRVSGIVARVFGHFSGLRAGDVVQAVWRRPNTSTYGTFSVVMAQDLSGANLWFSITLPSLPDVGTWMMDFVVNGVQTLTGPRFEVWNSGALPEIRIEDSTTEIVVDGRYTPFDFGSVVQGGVGASQTYRVYNHGYANLDISGISLPSGFLLTDGLPATLAPGASDTFTVRLDSSAPGYFAGEVRVFSNDADEAVSNFSVEGRVTVAGQGQLHLGISQRHTKEGQSIVANIRRNGSLASPLVVTLTTTDASELMLPATITIPAGTAEVLFTIAGAEDFAIDGDQTASIMATASGFSPARNVVLVQDNGVAGSNVVGHNVNGVSNPNRSGIREWTIHFDQAVTLASAGAIALFNQTTGQSVSVNGAMLIGNGTTSITWVLTD
ncbi:MAG: peptidoglycan DD-metalloendopeptidase family protein, partial [Planctomycetaceae bacterium]|nr:peptidoglycan DD-metalloendopeptidase family protein [Planctomycetaceae bacterium]